MSDVRFREAGQNYPREVATGDHGVAGVTAALVISGVKSGAANERWEFGYAYADIAQAGFGVGNERDPGATADDVCVDGEGACGISGSHRRVGADSEEMENEIKKFNHLLCIAK